MTSCAWCHVSGLPSPWEDPEWWSFPLDEDGEPGEQVVFCSESHRDMYETAHDRVPA